MDEKPRNFRAFKRALNRKVEREIAKRTKLERIASVLYKRYGESESNSESENESENIVNQCYIINANHDKNNDVTGDNNINVFNCNNDEDDHYESDNLENNELLRHDASNSELSIENFSDNENSSVHDTESTHTCTESDAEGIGVQELVSSDETDIEEEQIHCLHINDRPICCYKNKRWACEEDAPARAKIKCCKDHIGYCACEKCEVIGEYIDNRMTFVELNEPLRTDESYNNQEQPYHHTGHSPLEKIGTGLVSQFRLDGMHLIFLGVIKRLLLTWKMWNGPWKLRNTIAAISSELILLKPSCPQDFNRPPRSLAEISFYKATEFRRFLLYDGILVLRDYLDENIYKHFLLLHCGIYILSSPVLVKSYCKYAGQLLRTFIKHSVAIYGARFVAYNVHSMCHLEEECQQHGHLENFSAFVFENKLQGIKRLLHSGYKPLQQAAYRDLEKGPQNVILENEESQVFLSMQRNHPVNEIINGIQYKKITVNNIIFQCNNKDSCFKTVDGEIAILHNIVQRQGQIYFVGHFFSQTGNAYEYPLSSVELGIVRVSHLSMEKRIVLLTNIAAKCWLMPDGNSFVCVPLLHTIPLLK